MMWSLFLTTLLLSGPQDFAHAFLSHNVWNMYTSKSAAAAKLIVKQQTSFNSNIDNVYVERGLEFVGERCAFELLMEDRG